MHCRIINDAWAQFYRAALAQKVAKHKKITRIPEYGYQPKCLVTYMYTICGRYPAHFCLAGPRSVLHQSKWQGSVCGMKYSLIVWLDGLLQTMCIERTYFTTAYKLPGILRWFEVAKTSSVSYLTSSSFCFAPELFKYTCPITKVLKLDSIEV